jgi:uncharacterized membrane protein YdbT with pleckstrin-like domain
MMALLVQPLFRFLRLTLEPPAPIADARLEQVLQPGHRAHQLHLLKWAGAQLSALVGVVVVLTAFDFTQWLPRSLSFIEVFFQWADFINFLPDEWRWVGVILALGGFLVQLPLSFLSLWAKRRTLWYVVTNQGVQLRHGLWTTHETSLRFANIQQVTLKQGPLQRVLGLVDIVLSTAGQRSSGDDDDDEERKSRGQLRDLDSGSAQRLLTEIRQRLPSSADGAPPPHSAAAQTSAQAVEAAQLLLSEARTLRQSLEQQTGQAGS